MGQNEAKKPTSSVKFGNNQKCNLPVVNIQSKLNKTNLRMAKTMMNIRNPAAAILKYCTPILKINKMKNWYKNTS